MYHLFWSLLSYNPSVLSLDQCWFSPFFQRKKRDRKLNRIMVVKSGRNNTNWTCWEILWMRETVMPCQPPRRPSERPHPKPGPTQPPASFCLPAQRTTWGRLVTPPHHEVEPPPPGPVWAPHGQTSNPHHDLPPTPIPPNL